MPIKEIQALQGVLAGRQAAVEKRLAAAVQGRIDALDRTDALTEQTEFDTKTLEAGNADLHRALNGLTNGGPPLPSPSVEPASTGTHPGLAAAGFPVGNSK